MKRLDATYAPDGWWPWYARYHIADVVGESDEKVAVRALQLRRIRPAVLWRALRLGWGKDANLESANLRNARLEGANLEGANLEDANLRSANLESANLRSANLESANLRNARLEGANLEGAFLEGAFLEGVLNIDKASGNDNLRK